LPLLARLEGSSFINPPARADSRSKACHQLPKVDGHKFVAPQSLAIQ
jgi:hypothetical protein